MKTKSCMPMIIIGTLLIVLFCPEFYAQDTLAQKSHMLDLKLQLLDSKLDLLDSKIKLWEAKPKELDIRLEELDTKINSMDFNPKMMTKKLNELDSLLRKLKRGMQSGDAMPQVVTEQEYQYMPVYKSSIMLNPASLLEGTFHLSYERILNNRFSFLLGGMATYSTTKGISTHYFGNQSFAYFNSATQSYDKYNGEVMSGGGLNIQFRNYLRADYPNKLKAPLGLYAAPQLMFKNMKITGYYQEWEETDTVAHKFEMVDKNIVQHLNIFAGGVILGVKVPLLKVLTIDIYAGGNIKLSKYNNEAGFTKYKDWKNFDFSGVSPVVGIAIGILK